MKAEKKRKLIDAVREMGFSEQEASGMILSGKILIDGNRETRSGIFIQTSSKITVLKSKEYVSRSAEKLAGALSDFSLDVCGRACLDLGASTGGFVQVLLEKGARKVYAVDVGYNILDYSLRRDAKVAVLERHNVKDLNISWFSDEDMDAFQKKERLFVTCDISFMSLKTVVSSLVSFLEKEKISCDGVFLLKPQFEDSRNTEKGILADDSLREQIVRNTEQFLDSSGIAVKGILPARIKGASGNQEFVISFSYPADSASLSG